MPDAPRAVAVVDGQTIFVTPTRLGRRWRLHLDDVDELVERYQAGETLTALARAWNVSPSVVRRELVERGIAIRGAPKPPPKRSAEEVEELVRRHYAGATLTELAKEQGVTRQRIHHILRSHAVRKYGVPGRTAG